MNRKLLSILLIFAIIIPLITPLVDFSLTAPPIGGGWVKEGDRVYLNTTEAYISARPHTTSGGWVYFNYTGNEYDGRIDLVFGFNSEVCRPSGVWEGTLQKAKIERYVLPQIYFEEGSLEFMSTLEYESEDERYYFNGKVTLWNGHTYGDESEPWSMHTAWTPVYERDFIYLHKVSKRIEYLVPEHFTWKEITRRAEFRVRRHDFQGMDTWFMGAHKIKRNQMGYIRVWMDVIPSLTGSKGEYWFGFKPAHESLEESILLGHFWALDPWWSSSWGSRKTFGIEGAAGAGENYQMKFVVRIGNSVMDIGEDFKVTSTQSPLAWYDAANNRILFPYQSIDEKIRIRTYDSRSGEVLANYLVGDDPIPTDSHGTPSYIFYDGYHIVIYGDHSGSGTSQLRVSYSTNLEDWTMYVFPVAQNYTYPQLHIWHEGLEDERLILFIRHTLGEVSPPWGKVWQLFEVTDITDSGNWSLVSTVINTTRAGWYTYTSAHSRLTNDNSRLSIGWGLRNSTGELWMNVSMALYSDDLSIWKAVINNAVISLPANETNTLFHDFTGEFYAGDRQVKVMDVVIDNEGDDFWLIMYFHQPPPTYPLFRYNVATGKLRYEVPLAYGTASSEVTYDDDNGYVTLYMSMPPWPSNQRTIHKYRFYTANASFVKISEIDPGIAGPYHGVTAIALAPNEEDEWAILHFNKGYSENQNTQLKVFSTPNAGVDFGNTMYVDEDDVRSDFGDIRFIYDDELCDYWMEDMDEGIRAVFWIEIAANLSDTSLTHRLDVYYDNSAATSASNGDNTWITFDDYSVDSSGDYYHDATQATGAYFQDVSDGVFKLGRNDTSVGMDTYFLNATLEGGYRYRVSMYVWTSPASNITYMKAGITDTETAEPTWGHKDDFETSNTHYNITYGYGPKDILYTGLSSGSYFLLYSTYDNSSVESSMSIDWFGLGKYVSPEPYFKSFGSESVIVTNLDDTEWVFQSEKYYDFDFKLLSAPGPSYIDFMAFKLTDGINWINGTINVTEERIFLDEGEEVASIQLNSIADGEMDVTVSVGIFFKPDIFDAYDVDVQMWCNTTDGLFEDWVTKGTDVFNIYSVGGLSTLDILPAPPVAPGTYTFSPRDDSTVNQWLPDTTYGAQEWSFAGYVAAGSVYRGLFEFDVSSLDGAVITSATLYLNWYLNMSTTVSQWVAIHRATSNWVEETVTWNLMPTFAGTPSAIYYIPTDAYGWWDFDVTVDVQAWTSGTTNYGFLMKRVTEAAPANYYRVRSKEYGTAALRPYLEVEVGSIAGRTTGGAIFELYTGPATYVPADIFDESFNGGTIAGGWYQYEPHATTVIDIDISTEQFNSYAYSVKIFDDYNLNNAEFNYDFGSETTTFTYQVFVRPAQNDSLLEVNVKGGYTYAHRLFFNTDSNITYRTGGSDDNVVAYAANTWYNITMVLNFATKEVDIWVNDSLEADDWAWTVPTINSLDTIVFLSEIANANAASFYIDSIKLWRTTSGGFVGSATATQLWRKFQHVTMQFAISIPGATDTTLQERLAGEAYVEIGIDYRYNGAWINNGWKVRMEFLEGKDEDVNQYVLVNASWYNNDVFVKNDTFYAWWEGYDGEKDYFRLFADLWFSDLNNSRRIGGRVNAMYYGQSDSSAWYLRWLTGTQWSPLVTDNDQSMFEDDLKDTELTVISSRELDLFRVRVKVDRSNNYEYQLVLRDFDTYDKKLAPVGGIMVGIGTPIFVKVVNPEMPGGGLLEALASALSSAWRVIFDQIVFGGLLIVDTLVGWIDGFIEWAGGPPNLIANLGVLLSQLVTWFSQSITNIIALLTPLGLILFDGLSFFITVFTMFITVFLQIAAIVMRIFDGTQTGIGALTDIWTTINISTWAGAIPIFLIIMWFSSLDSRGRRTGSWLGVFVGDASAIMNITAFFLDLFLKIFDVVVATVSRIIEFIPLI